MDRVARMYSSYQRPRRRHEIPEPEKKPVKPEKEPEHAPGPLSQEPAQTPQNGLLEQLMQDKDQSLVLLLLVLLMKDGADMNLVLALIYLLL